MAFISIIFSGANMAIRISEYLNLTDSLSCRISRLEQMHQKSAREALRHALSTNDDTLRKKYIIRAVEKYFDAVSIETDDQALFGAYEGLACCHSLLNDVNNRNAAIENALCCYNRISSEANDEAEGFIAMQADGDEVLHTMLKGIWGICTLGVANVVDAGVKKIQEARINNYKEKEKEMRGIANQIKSQLK